MSVPLAITVNLLTDLALIGGLAWVMTRPRRLASGPTATQPPPAPPPHRHAAPRPSLRSRLTALTDVG
jgi:hypothetical protein